MFIFPQNYFLSLNTFNNIRSQMTFPYQIKSFEDYQKAYKNSVEQPELFWEDIARSFKWRKTWDKVLEWNFSEPKVEWFAGAKFNITENCIDRHLEALGEKPAFIWEPNHPDEG
jgi:acetyl-CoA synthetase